ncbi:DUF3866 family protein [Pseudactinotalea sp. Z1739]|uniref:DUF3866 family protein n=1 Tax=Pseudactinotalea sp. Z1739 TaxID=3413028 RepID=UPI003C7B9FAB
MITWREGVVTELGRAWTGSIEMQVSVGDETIRALAYPDLVGHPRPGDRVLLNTTALARGLGTGGYAFVVALPDRLPPDPPPGPGHIIKSRYTPLQTMVLAADEQESPFHSQLADAADLDGLPVVVADLHSALPAVLAGARWAAGQAGAARPRVAYLMTDDAALPVWFSRAVAGLREADWLIGTISVGQAFGGDHEAVNVHTGLLVARYVLGADLVVVAQGPGNVGTGTAWGFSGVAVGEALNAAAALGGAPVAVLRVSGADRRTRHYGISHHSLTALTKVALRPVEIPVPVLPAALAEVADRIQEQSGALTAAGHRLCPVGTDGLTEALAQSPVPLSTMGRGLDQDPASFLTAAVAGVLAHTLSGGDQGR